MPKDDWAKARDRDIVRQRRAEYARQLELEAMLTTIDSREATELSTQSNSDSTARFRARDDKLRKCPKCNFLFTSDELKIHLTEVHGDEATTSGVRPRKKRTKPKAAKLRSGWIRCPICSQGMNPGSIPKHFRKHHRGRDFMRVLTRLGLVECSVCGCVLKSTKESTHFRKVHKVTS